MNEGTASVVRTLIKSAAVVVILIGWPQLRKPHVINQTIIQPSEAEDLVMRSVILELNPNQDSEKYIYFQRMLDDETLMELLTDEYVMLRSSWEKDGEPKAISLTVSNLVEGKAV